MSDDVGAGTHKPALPQLAPAPSRFTQVSSRVHCRDSTFS